VRGDAYRLVGREIEARRAFAEAARSVLVPTSPSRMADGAPADDPANDPTNDAANDLANDPANAQAAAPARAEPPTEGDSA
jgi:hypothetical protein